MPRTPPQSVTVTPGVLDHLEVSPSNVEILPGQASPALSAAGYDTFGNYIGDVTGATEFTVGSGQPCTGTTCTESTPGAYQITATDGNASGHASLTADQPPVPVIQSVQNSSGSAPDLVTFTLEATDPLPGQTLTYTMNYGDGSAPTAPLPVPNGPFTVTHSYGACGSCQAVFTVNDGLASPAPSASTSIDVAPDVPRPPMPVTPRRSSWARP